MEVKIITADYYHTTKKGKFGSSTIRGYWIADRWDEASLYKCGSKADVMIYQKVFWKWHMQDFKGIKILDLCDPDWMKGDMDIKELSSMVDAVTTSTENLAKRVREWVDIPVVCIPDRVNLDIVTPREKHAGKLRNAVWYGYSNNAEHNLPKVLRSLANRGIDLHIVSDREPNLIDDCGVNITFTKYEYETAYSVIKQADVCLNPNFGGSNFDYKSNNKTIIAWALGLPVVTTLEELDKFIEAEDRNKEIEKRKKEIDEKWEIKYSVEEYKNLIKEICKKKKITI